MKIYIIVYFSKILTYHTFTFSIHSFLSGVEVITNVNVTSGNSAVINHTVKTGEANFKCNASNGVMHKMSDEEFVDVKCE
jgi:hypothetical protein